MPTFRYRRPRKIAIAQCDDRLSRLKRIAGGLTRTRVTVRRDEHDAEAALRQLEQQTNNLEHHHTRDRETQFKRITAVQPDLDVNKCGWTKAKIG